MITNPVGVTIPNYKDVADLHLLEEKLVKVSEMGFTAVELPIQGMELIRNGEVNKASLKATNLFLVIFICLIPSMLLIL